ncbi:hypothetical protein DENSPDRAFT_885332 [Dentipellis sp. KUC8613]|nr:hypothetical protein DENSPDRAFT_885332 [Dentipellis sp. KUC8613]
MPLTFDRAVLGALFTECIVYGICTTMSIITLLVILRARSEHAALPHKLLLFALALMMILATSHIGLSLAWVFEGFILKPSFLGGSSAYFESTRTPVLVTKDAVLLVQTLLGDNIYIWRCYMIWGRRKRVVVVPVITMILASVYTCMAEYTLAHSWDNVFDEPRRWIKGFCGFMLATILYCNVAIIWKIWRTNRSTHTATLIVVIETGTLYTANLIAFLVTYVIADFNLAHIRISVFDEPSRWLKGFCTFMLATIVYCNVAIIWKIWRTSKSKNRAILIVIIETGVIYTANLIAFLVLYTNESAALYITLDLFGPLVPIVFCLIILQIKYHRATGSDTSPAMTAPNGSAVFSAVERLAPQNQKKHRSTSTATALSNSDFMLKPTEIRIEMPEYVVKHHINVGEAEV